MSTPQTQLTIYNLALDYVNEPPAQSLLTESAPMRLLNRNWAVVREALLRSYPWSFAKRRMQLTAEADAPDSEWDYAYKLPPDYIRLLSLVRYGDRNEAPVHYEIVGNYIETDEQGPLRIKYVYNAEEPGAWDTLFVQCMALSLAVKLASKFVGKKTYLADIRNDLKEALALASGIVNIEDTPEPIEQHDVIRVRR